MRITPRPIAASDEIDKSRDVAGFNKWARSSRTVSFIMLIFGWFTIPPEVLLRRDFGQRWFTVINFYAGLLLLVIFSLLQHAINWLSDAMQAFITSIATAFNPSYRPPEPTESDIMDSSMFLVLMVYVLVGSFHLFKIWWRKRTNTGLHSFDDGTSRLVPLARLVTVPLNILAVPVLFLCMRLLPKKQRVVKKAPKLISDPEAFTDTVLEPLLLLFLAKELNGVASLWLFISGIALAIHANWKETARQSKILDFRDSALEAKVMVQLKEEQASTLNVAPQQAGVAAASNMQPVSYRAHCYPSLMAIIEEMDRDGSHLSG